MHVDHPDAELGTGGYRLGDGIGNVVKFQIQKDIKSLGNQLAYKLRTKQGKHLLANLETALGRRNTFNERQGISFVLIIQRYQYFWIEHLTSY